MMPVGVEKLNAYCGSSYVDVEELAIHRGLDTSRFENLLIREKSVVLPFEDPVSLAVNAARPLVESLSQDELDRIELLVTCTESAFDMSKSLSTYVHDYLKLGRNCRMAEVKNACYSGTFGLQTAVNFVLANVSAGAKALVVATDISRFVRESPEDSALSDWSFVEPSSGAGAVALLVSDRPKVLEIDVGANGYYGFEVMDTCRPEPDSEAGNSDVSLLAYLECCENAYREYVKRVPETDYVGSFDYLSFHTPFGGMVKGAHRSMMRKFASSDPALIASDFDARVTPGLELCQRVGNIMGATSALSLASTIAHGDFRAPRRIGVFSYGSGCCSEFYSGVVTEAGQSLVKGMGIGESLESRYRLGMAEYDELIDRNVDIRFGTRDLDVDRRWLCHARPGGDRPLLVLDAIRDFHREYRWLDS